MPRFISIEPEWSWAQFQRQQAKDRQAAELRCQKMIAEGYDLESVKERFGSAIYDAAHESLGTAGRKAASQNRGGITEALKPRKRRRTIREAA